MGTSIKIHIYYVRGYACAASEEKNDSEGLGKSQEVNSTVITFLTVYMNLCPRSHVKLMQQSHLNR